MNIQCLIPSLELERYTLPEFLRKSVLSRLFKMPMLSQNIAALSGMIMIPAILNLKINV